MSPDPDKDVNRRTLSDDAIDELLDSSQPEPDNATSAAALAVAQASIAAITEAIAQLTDAGLSLRIATAPESDPPPISVIAPDGRTVGSIALTPDSSTSNRLRGPESIGHRPAAKPLPPVPPRR